MHNFVVPGATLYGRTGPVQSIKSLVFSSVCASAQWTAASGTWEHVAAVPDFFDKGPGVLQVGLVTASVL